jgi:hypothetical protein
MSNRFPLVIDSATQRILELPATDNLDLSSSNISNVTNINSVGNVTANYFIGNGSSLTNITASPAGANTQIQFNNAGVLGANSNFTINTSSGVLSALYFSGNGAALTSLAGANVTGTVANASYAISAGSATTATTATTAGTVTTAAQPNITSLGTLTSLNISGTSSPGNLLLTKFNETLPASANTSTTITPDVATGTIFRYTANANFTFNSLANAVAGSSATVIITQDATGSRLLTSTMKFAGASKTLSTAAASIDIIGVFYDGSTYYASLTKGYA